MISTEATGNFITFGDNVNGFAGRIQYSHATNAMQFETLGSEKMRIDSSGKMIIPAIADGIKFEITSSAGSGYGIIEMGQVGSDGFLDVSAAGGGIVTHLSGYTGYASYFLSTGGFPPGAGQRPHRYHTPAHTRRDHLRHRAGGGYLHPPCGLRRPGRARRRAAAASLSGFAAAPRSPRSRPPA